MNQRKSRPKKKLGFSEDGAAFDAATDRAPTRQTVELGAGGRLVIPAPMRAALGMKVGDRLTMRLDGNQLRVYTFQEGLRQARAIVGKHLPAGADPVEDFLQWKREQAALEEAKHEKWPRDE
ncbi:MAG: Antidote-toxin recognition MazE, bacterial antitoxin [Alphaproteobacteria bacterium]|nr:Antidote-toxin recognition MazE, bacterial antitoxin [Alphaproteobacteria bacterium]